MKLGRTFKPVFLGTLAALYATGLGVWLLETRFRVDDGYGPAPSPWKPLVLHAHSISGLLFLALFGYLWKAHIEPGLARKKKKNSGLVLIAVLGLLFASVPLLFYLTGETARAWSAAVHTWVGAGALAPFLFHIKSRHA